MHNNLAHLKSINKDFTSLYVEDNTSVRKQTIKMLENFLPNIIEGINGEEGINLFLAHEENPEVKSFDLIITDIEMPQKNGLEMIKKIRTFNSTVPIIIFSAHDKSRYFLEAINIGIDGYILKPYDLEQIIEVLANTIKKITSNKLIKFENGFHWCLTNKVLKNDDTQIKLSKNEMRLIDFLISLNKGIKSSESIENYIFDDFVSNNKRVRNLISRLNTKVGIGMIESIYGEGYRLKHI